MKQFARIEAGHVVEIITTLVEPSEIFHPALEWREAADIVEIGWLATAGGFEAPPPPVVVPLEAPDLDQLQAELNALIARVAAFKAG